ncbi:MAG: helix-turn-helix domain-containing protein [Candidatus Binataceae bacterium]
MKAATPSPVMTLKELCAYLHIHPATLYRLVRKGEIPFFKIGDEYRFRNACFTTSPLGTGSNVTLRAQRSERDRVKSGATPRGGSFDPCFCGIHGAFVILKSHTKTTAAPMALRFKARRSKHGNKGFVGPEAQRS